jgi:hypothetical protein
VGAFIGRPRSGSRACERGQFAATVRAPARGDPYCPLRVGLHPFGQPFCSRITSAKGAAHELAFLGSDEYVLSVELAAANDNPVVECRRQVETFGVGECGAVALDCLWEPFSDFQ